MNIPRLIDPATKLGLIAYTYTNTIKSAIFITAWSILAFFIGCVAFVLVKGIWLMLLLALEWMSKP